jgi:hypothetical protein
VHAYLVYGLHVSSGTELPELMTVSHDSSHDVLVREGAVEVAPPPDREMTSWVHVNAEARETRCVYEGVGRFCVRDGREIIVDPLPDTDPGLWRHILLGPVFAQLLWQRGLFTLHASVVRVGTRAVAFVAESGEGKSTTAAALESEGHALLCDDIAAIPWRERPIRALPGFPRIRLYADSVKGIGEAPEELPRIHRHIEKHLRPARRFLPEPMPLSAIYVLATGPGLRVVPLEKRELMIELMRHSYNASQLAPIVGFGRHMQMAACVAEEVPGHRIERPRDLTRLPELVRCIEQHVAR